MYTLIAGIAGGYLCGSLVWGYWIGRLRGCDVRRHGSGNIGATNVYRVLGKGPGAVTLLLDIAKGALPVLLARRFLPSLGPAGLVAVGAAAVVGNTFPVFLRFKGGKGVNCSFGVVLALFPAAAACALAVWLLVFLPSGIVSLASLCAALSLPFWIYAFQQNAIHTAAGAAIFLLIAWTHRANIRRLFRGEEPRTIPWKRLRS